MALSRCQIDHVATFLDVRLTPGSEVICDELVWDKAIFFQQLAHQFERRPLVPPGLDQHLEHFALGVDGAPQINHAQVRRDLGSKMVHSSILIAHIITKVAPSAIATFIVPSSSLVIAPPLIELLSKLPSGRSADKAPRLRRLKGAAAQKSTGLLPRRTHCYGRRPVDLLGRRRAEGSPRDVRGFGSCERQVRRREPTDPKPMSTISIAKSRNPKSAAPKKRSVKPNATYRRNATSVAATAKAPPKSDEPKGERVTKQERLLTLLSQAAGASIEEMMQATDWQQHSVRGFLAGTVKKKLGFSLTTSKAAGDVRRYRIETRRGR